MRTATPIRTLLAFRLYEVPQVLHTLRHGEIVGHAVMVPNETSR
ncbi:hypothetical protein [Pseudomonas laurylsulfatiphila]